MRHLFATALSLHYVSPEDAFIIYVGQFFLSLLISLVVYCVPVLIYRFLIRDGQPLESKWKATWVGWIFWICSFTAICLYYLAAGYYEEEGFSVRAGLPDFICMVVNWVLLYCKFGFASPTGKEAEIVLRNVNNAPPQEPAPEDTHSPRCSACGSSLPPNAKFCPECGEKVLPPGITICQECGELVEQGKFCTECGCKSATDILPNAETKNPPSSDSPAKVPENTEVIDVSEEYPESTSSEIKKAAKKETDDEYYIVRFFSAVILLFVFVVLFSVLYACNR